MTHQYMEEQCQLNLANDGTIAVKAFQTFIRHQFAIDGKWRFIVRYESDLKWWIVPKYGIHSGILDDIGPFEMSSDAVMMAILLSK